MHGLSKLQKAHLSGFASFEAGIGVSAKVPRARATARMSNAGVNLCPRNFGSNVLVNQNCLNVTDPDLQGRGQAQNETAIAQNPFNPRQLVTGFNDYRRGDGTCGTAFSGNGGASWNDTTMPNGFTRGTVSATLPARTGRPATRRWPGTAGQRLLRLPGVHARPSTTNNPDPPARCMCSAPTVTPGVLNFTGNPAIGLRHRPAP
jgi:hypothetical protein